jgi:hypothetical protein
MQTPRVLGFWERSVFLSLTNTSTLINKPHYITIYFSKHQIRNPSLQHFCHKILDDILHNMRLSQCSPLKITADVSDEHFVSIFSAEEQAKHEAQPCLMSLYPCR